MDEQTPKGFCLDPIVGARLYNYALYYFSVPLSIIFVQKLQMKARFST
jgi:hypothetical protein